MLWLKFARRYIFSPKSHSVINLIAIVSVVAVAVPTAALVILLSMFNGLNNTIANIYSAVDADMEIIASRGQTFHQSDISLEAVGSVEGVAATAPFVEQNVMAAAKGRRTTLTLKGIDARYFDVLPIASYITHGSSSAIEAGGIILGKLIASELGVYALDTEIELYALNRKQFSSLLPLSGITRVRTAIGAFVVSNADISSSVALMDISKVQAMLNYDDKLSGIAIRCKEGADISHVEQKLQQLVGERYEVRTRGEKNASMDAIIRMEKFAVVLIGTLIAIVAALSIVGSVVMLITDKRRDIATLRSMGATRHLARTIFVLSLIHI